MEEVNYSLIQDLNRLYDTINAVHSITPWFSKLAYK